MNIKEFIQESLTYLISLDEDKDEFLLKQNEWLKKDQLENLKKLDPTNGKYLVWLVKQYKNDKEVLNDKNIPEYLKLYTNPKLKNKLDEKDKNIMNLNLYQLKEIYHKFLNSNELLSDNEIKETAYIGNNGNYNIYKLATYKQSLLLGKGTNWCVSADSENGISNFISYSKTGPLFVFIKENDPKEKYLMHLNSAGNIMELANRSQNGEHDLQDDEYDEDNDYQAEDDIIDEIINKSTISIIKLFSKDMLKYFNLETDISVKLQDLLVYSNKKYNIYKPNNYYEYQYLLDIKIKPSLERIQRFNLVTVYVFINKSDKNDKYILLTKKSSNGIDKLTAIYSSAKNSVNNIRFTENISFMTFISWIDILDKKTIEFLNINDPDIVGTIENIEYANEHQKEILDKNVLIKNKDIIIYDLITKYHPFELIYILTKDIKLSQVLSQKILKSNTYKTTKLYFVKKDKIEIILEKDTNGIIYINPDLLFNKLNLNISIYNILTYDIAQKLTDNDKFLNNIKMHEFIFNSDNKNSGFIMEDKDYKIYKIVNGKQIQNYLISPDELLTSHRLNVISKQLEQNDIYLFISKNKKSPIEFYIEFSKDNYRDINLVRIKGDELYSLLDVLSSNFLNKIKYPNKKLIIAMKDKEQFEKNSADFKRKLLVKNYNENNIDYFIYKINSYYALSLFDNKTHWSPYNFTEFDILIFKQRYVILQNKDQQQIKYLIIKDAELAMYDKYMHKIDINKQLPEVVIDFLKKDKKDV